MLMCNVITALASRSRRFVIRRTGTAGLRAGRYIRGAGRGVHVRLLVRKACSSVDNQTGVCRQGNA